MGVRRVPCAIAVLLGVAALASPASGFALMRALQALHSRPHHSGPAGRFSTPEASSAQPSTPPWPPQPPPPPLPQPLPLTPTLPLPAPKTTTPANGQLTIRSPSPTPPPANNLKFSKDELSVSWDGSSVSPGSEQRIIFLTLFSLFLLYAVPHLPKLDEVTAFFRDPPAMLTAFMFVALIGFLRIALVGLDIPIGRDAGADLGTHTADDPIYNYLSSGTVCPRSDYGGDDLLILFNPATKVHFYQTGDGWFYFWEGSTPETCTAPVRGGTYVNPFAPGENDEDWCHYSFYKDGLPMTFNFNYRTRQHWVETRDEKGRRVWIWFYDDNIPYEELEQIRQAKTSPGLAPSAKSS
jgi:hypothetical protein